jgi:hypothetical protein
MVTGFIDEAKGTQSGWGIARAKTDSLVILFGGEKKIYERGIHVNANIYRI